MGSYRLLLAVLVLLSHAGVSVYGYNPGVVAVISFFLLSGYVMTILIGRHYSSPGRVTDFYLDRAARLFPQFLFYCAATGLLMATHHISSPFLGGCDATRIGMNLAMLPLGFFMSKGLGLGHCLIIPQAWSLGLELCFYIVAPAIVLLPQASRLAVCGSVIVFLTAYIGLINTDTYGYRLLLGTFFIFSVGAAFADRSWLGTKFPWIIWSCAVALFAIIHVAPPLLALSYNKEVLLGLIIGIPALGLLKSRQFSTLDEFLGNLSYGMFLNHFFCIWLIRFAFGLEIIGVQHYFLLLVLSTAMALVSYYIIERPALRWRQALRYQLSAVHEGEFIAAP